MFLIYKTEHILLLTSRVDVKMNRMLLACYPFNKYSPNISFIISGPALAPIEVIAKGSLALLLNEQLMPKKGVRGSASCFPPTFLLLPISCLMDSTGGDGGPGHSLDAGEQTSKWSNEKEEAHSEAYLKRQLRPGKCVVHFSQWPENKR